MSDYQILRRQVSQNVKYHPMFQGRCEKNQNESETTGSTQSLSIDGDNEYRSQENFIENSSQNLLIQQLKEKISQVVQYKNKMEKFFDKQINQLKTESEFLEKQNTILRTAVGEMKDQVKQIKTDLRSLQNHLGCEEIKLKGSVKLQKKSTVPKERKFSVLKSGKLLRSN